MRCPKFQSYFSISSDVIRVRNTFPMIMCDDLFSSDVKMNLYEKKMKFPKLHFEVLASFLNGNCTRSWIYNTKIAKQMYYIWAFNRRTILAYFLSMISSLITSLSILFTGLVIYQMVHIYVRFSDHISKAFRVLVTNMPVSFKYEYRRLILSSGCDVISDGINMISTFSLKICIWSFQISCQI